MGCLYQAAIQRGKIGCWEYQALTRWGRHAKGIALVRKSEEGFTSRARRDFESGQMFKVIFKILKA